MDVPLTALALLMLGLMVAELALPLSPAWARRVIQAETAIWLVFVADFVLELALAPSKISYLKRNWLTAVSVSPCRMITLPPRALKAEMSGL